MRTAYKTYLLTLLTIILAFNFIDRIVLSLTLQDIKIDLGLSDTQLGLLTGIAFAFFYSIMGIPIARWADRGNRAIIISLTTAIWSIAVALCGMIGNFIQLLAVRVAVAIGEAGCIPPAHSLIADTFERSQRPRAAARYMLGAPIAGMIGYFLIGWLNESYGWRTTFMVVGPPGVVLAVLAALTIREPRRAAQKATADLPPVPAADATRPPQPTMAQVFASLWANGTFRHLLICWSVWYFFGYGLTQWQPTFFIRSHGLSTGELGLWLAVIYGGGAFIGIVLGGEWATRYAPSNERRQLVGVAAVFTLFIPLMAGVLLAQNLYLAFALLAVKTIVGNLPQGPILATTQTLVPPHMRAMALAILYLFANLIGMGLGPWAVGWLSDLLQPSAGQESLRYALLAFCPGYLWVIWHLWRASRTVTADVAAVRTGETAEARGERLAVMGSS